MPKIQLVTEIKSSLDICFDLSRSIDLHKISTAQTNEEAIDGTTSGLIGLGECVTWQARHFGIKQRLTSKITAFDRPHYFQDAQIKGIFKSFQHDHRFELKGDKVIMTDVFDFESPLGILGRLFNQLVLTRYMQQLLIDRNKVIKAFAESDKWQQVLENQ